MDNFTVPLTIHKRSLHILIVLNFTHIYSYSLDKYCNVIGVGYLYILLDYICITLYKTYLSRQIYILFHILGWKNSVYYSLYSTLDGYLCSSRLLSFITIVSAKILSAFIRCQGGILNMDYRSWCYFNLLFIHVEQTTG